MYAALLTAVDGTRLLSPQLTAAIGQVAFAGTDEIFGMPAAWTLGFARGGPGSQPGDQATWFGRGGVGGAYAGADSATGTTLAVSKNRLSADFTTAAQFGAVLAG
jgi:hypothetical protein